MALHDAAARGFPRAAAAYDSGRPEYPSPAVERLAAVLRLRPGRTVLELAAGTGKLTRALRPWGARLVALEPVSAMRARFAENLPGTSLVGGRAEALPFSGGCADGVAVGQGFHWFRADTALDECARVLRPGGVLALVWNVRDERHPFMAALTRLLDTRRGATPSYRDGRWKTAVASHPAFGPLRRATTTFVQRASRDVLVDRVRSISFVATLPDSARSALVERALALADELAQPSARGEYALRYRTELYWCVRRPTSSAVSRRGRRSPPATGSAGTAPPRDARARRTDGRAPRAEPGGTHGLRRSTARGTRRRRSSGSSRTGAAAPSSLPRGDSTPPPARRATAGDPRTASRGS